MAYVPVSETAQRKADALPQYYSQPGKTTRPAPPDGNAHWWDEVQFDVFNDFNDDVEWLVDTIAEGTRAPFSANVNNEQKLDYFRSKLFNDNGTPNDPGRAELMKTYGGPGVAKIMADVMDKQAKPFVIEPKDFYLYNKDEADNSAPPEASQNKASTGY